MLIDTHACYNFNVNKNYARHTLQSKCDTYRETEHRKARAVHVCVDFKTKRSTAML